MNKLSKQARAFLLNGHKQLRTDNLKSLLTTAGQYPVTTSRPKALAFTRAVKAQILAHNEEQNEAARKTRREKRAR